MAGASDYAGRIEENGKRGKALKADYVLEYRNTKLAVIEAKAWDEPLTEGVGQAKDYAGKMAIRFTYATNGQAIYGIDMETGAEREIAGFPTPDGLWESTFATPNAWRDRFAKITYPDKSELVAAVLPGPCRSLQAFHHRQTAGGRPSEIVE